MNKDDLLKLLETEEDRAKTQKDIEAIDAAIIKKRLLGLTIGKHLSRIRSRFPYGTYLDFIETRWRLSSSTAQDYTDFYETYGDSPELLEDFSRTILMKVAPLPAEDKNMVIQNPEVFGFRKGGAKPVIDAVKRFKDGEATSEEVRSVIINQIEAQTSSHSDSQMSEIRNFPDLKYLEKLIDNDLRQYRKMEKQVEKEDISPFDLAQEIYKFRAVLKRGEMGTFEILKRTVAFDVADVDIGEVDIAA